MMSPEEIKEEYERCKNDMYYFYIKYINFGDEKLTREEWDERMKLINSKPISWKRR